MLSLQCRRRARSMQTALTFRASRSRRAGAAVGTPCLRPLVPAASCLLDDGLSIPACIVESWWVNASRKTVNSRSNLRGNFPRKQQPILNSLS